MLLYNDDLRKAHYLKEILNAFNYKYTNGPTEGYNNTIKVLRRVSYGIKTLKDLETESYIRVDNTNF